MMEWQTIETAPTRFNDTNSYLIAKFYDWQEEEGVFVKKMAWSQVAQHCQSFGWSLALKGLKNAWGGCILLPLEEATHWAYIPAPPKEEGNV